MSLETRIQIASDVAQRDGIGVEIYQNDELIIEIFRDDTKKTRAIKVFKDSVSLEEMQMAIEAFKKEIPWEFMR